MAVTPLAANREFRRILVVCTRRIGDVLLTTPLIRAARGRWPAAEIDVLGFAGTLGVLDGNPDLSRCIEVRPSTGWFASLPLIRRLWRRYDLALIAQLSDRAHLYGWVAGRTRAGLVPGNPSLAWWKRRLLHHAVLVYGEETHMAVEKFPLLAPWLDRPPAEVSVVPPAGAALPQTVSSMLRSPLVVVHVPSMWRYKQWPLAHYRTLIAGLLGDGVQVALTGGPSESDRAHVSAMRDLGAQPDLIDVCGQLSFAQLVTLFRHADLYVGPDTSVTHLAAACDLPVIALFGPTTPQLWGPWPQRSALRQPYAKRNAARTQLAGRVILLQGSNDCVPCSRAGCDDHADSRSDCLEGMAAERVLVHAREVLAAAKPDRPSVLPAMKDG